MRRKTAITGNVRLSEVALARQPRYFLCTSFASAPDTRVTRARASGAAADERRLSAAVHG